MTWEETIQFIRREPGFENLIRDAYFDPDLSKNTERFRTSEEYIETLRLIKKYAPQGKRILDIGSGNGISCIAFALNGYQIDTVEPDPSNTIGAGAIQLQKEYYGLKNITIHQDYAENISFDDNTFDIVYLRQSMHHANDLNKFLEECGRVLRTGGLLFTSRDHVIYDSDDKARFLNAHPLHQYYGGENAYTDEEYQNAITQANISIVKKLRYFDSVINYFPLTQHEKENLFDIHKSKSIVHLQSKIGFLASINFIQKLYLNRIGLSLESVYDENRIPGRPYSYLGIKK